MKPVLFSIFLLVTASTNINAQDNLAGQQKQRLHELWSISNGLYEPESIAYDPISNKLFVTNVRGYSKNGLGYISRLDADGSNFEANWLTGLNGPTGIIFHDGKLYFADIDTLKVADATSGDILAEYQTSDENPGLNDVTIGPNETIYISASNSATIYKLIDGQLSVFIHDARALRNANGLLATNNILISGGDALHAWQLETGTHLGLLAAENSEINNIDGITINKNGALILSLLNDPRLWQLKPAGSYSPVDQQQVHGVDITLHPALNLLFTPRINLKTKEYSITAYMYDHH